MNYAGFTGWAKISAAAASAVWVGADPVDLIRVIAGSARPRWTRDKMHRDAGQKQSGGVDFPQVMQVRLR